MKFSYILKQIGKAPLQAVCKVARDDVCDFGADQKLTGMYPLGHLISWECLERPMRLLDCRYRKSQ